MQAGDKTSTVASEVVRSSFHPPNENRNEDLLRPFHEVGIGDRYVDLLVTRLLSVGPLGFLSCSVLEKRN